MTEDEWLASMDVRAMLSFLRNSPSTPGQQKLSRKYRLFACACARRVWDRLGDDDARAAVVVAERLADRQVTPEELERARRSARGTARKTLLRSGRMAANDVSSPYPADPTLALLLRDIFPFAPTPADPRWRTADVVGVARGVYEGRAFGRLSLLGDALMDAGCGDEQILAHCRSAGPHVRGCWVVDLVLGQA